MLRLLRSLIFFWESSERRAEARRKLQSTYEVERAKADFRGQDYFLQRDLAQAKDEDKQKPK
jgi:hypothetical protein